MKYRKIAWLGAVWLSIGCGENGTAQAEDSPRLLASQCAQCHGTNGHAIGDIDDLAGEGDEILEEFMEWQNETPDDIMEHQARGYTWAQVRMIADYYDSMSSTYTPDYPGFTSGSGWSDDDDDDYSDDHSSDDDDESEYSDDDQQNYWYKKRRYQRDGDDD